MIAVGREAEWAAWMRSAMAGDGGSYRRFLTAVTPHVRSIARARCRALGTPEAEAEDIVQDVLLAIHLKRGTWDQDRPIGPWIGAIARNKVIDAFRRAGGRAGRLADVPIDDVIETLPAEDTAPDLTTRDIDRFLARLKDQQRDIVQSISLDGKGIRETAARLRMTEVAVRVALHRALKALAALYRSDSDEH